MKTWNEWEIFIGALLSPSVVLPLILTVALFIGAYFAPQLWSTILYIVTTLTFGFVGLQFNKRFKNGMTKEEVMLEDAILADVLEMMSSERKMNNGEFAGYVVKKLRRH